MTGQEAGGGSSEGCGAFQAVGGSTGGGRPAGLCPSGHRRLLLLVLLKELRVLELILEVLQMLPLLVMMVLLVVVELLRGRRRDVLLVHDAAAGSLWLVDEGSRHGGDTNWGGGEAWLRVSCVGEGEPIVREYASTSGKQGGIWMRCLGSLSLAWTSPGNEGETRPAKKEEIP